MKRAYHDRSQPFRIQKRLVLNRCFKVVYDLVPSRKPITYVTFGGRDLYDLMDLVFVFDVSEQELNVISYEVDPEAAKYSQSAPVTKTLSRLRDVSIDIVNAEFPSRLDLLRRYRGGSQFIVFLDYTKVFSEKEAVDVQTLLSEDLLKSNDFLLITSCINPRVVNQDGFMKHSRSTYQLLFKEKMPSGEAMVRNHVDLLMALAFARHKRDAYDLQREFRLKPQLLRKYRYHDTSDMGVWLFQVVRSESENHVIEDRGFERYPDSFVKTSPETSSGPSIFD